MKKIIKYNFAAMLFRAVTPSLLALCAFLGGYSVINANGSSAQSKANSEEPIGTKIFFPRFLDERSIYEHKCTYHTDIHTDIKQNMKKQHPGTPGIAPDTVGISDKIMGKCAVAVKISYMQDQDKKTEDTKSQETKSSDTKSTGTKSTDTKSTDTNIKDILFTSNKQFTDWDALLNHFATYSWTERITGTNSKPTAAVSVETVKEALKKVENKHKNGAAWLMKLGYSNGNTFYCQLPIEPISPKYFKTTFVSRNSNPLLHFDLFNTSIEQLKRPYEAWDWKTICNSRSNDAKLISLDFEQDRRSQSEKDTFEKLLTNKIKNPHMNHAHPCTNKMAMNAADKMGKAVDKIFNESVRELNKGMNNIFTHDWADPIKTMYDTSKSMMGAFKDYDSIDSMWK